MAGVSETKIEKTGNCAICGLTYDNFGNNPEPLMAYERRVCSTCNSTLVIPARLGTDVTLTTYEGERVVFRCAKPKGGA